MGVPRWPLWVWGLQLVPAAFLLSFAIWRLIESTQLQASPAMTFLAFAIGAAWSSLVLAVLAFRRTRQWLVRRRMELLLSAVTTLVCLLFFDLALTYFGVVPTIEQQREVSLTFSFSGLTRTRLVSKDIARDGGTIHINRRGLRGSEIEPEKDPNKLRIVFLGASQVFDYSGLDWPALTGEALQALGQDVEVINAGTPGHTTVEALAKMVTDIWTLQPDIVFLCQAWNDSKYFSSLNPHEPYGGLAPTSAQSWQRDWRLYPSGLDWVFSHSAVYRQFRWGLAHFLYGEEGRPTEDPQVIFASAIGTWGPKQYRLNLELIAGLSKAIQAEFVLCKQAHLAVAGGTGEAQEAAQEYGFGNVGLPHDELMRAYEISYQVVEDVAQKHDALVVDMTTPISGRPEFFADGVHFNPQGSRFAAQLVAEALLPLVARLSSASGQN